MDAMSLDKRLLEREALRNMIQQWNANRLDLFELSEPNENLEFHGVMRFYFQDSGQKIATKCIRVASDATVSDVIETLIEKFRPDMRMLSVGSYSLWETHGPHEERKLESHEKPLLVQLSWHADDREGRFLLKCIPDSNGVLHNNNNVEGASFKRKLSKREKKELKKKEKLARMKSENSGEPPSTEKLYTELPETSFTRSISNPEAVMRRQRQQKLERRLQQFRSRDGGPDTGGTLKIYGSSVCPDVPYKTLLVSIRDTTAYVLRETLEKYGLTNHDTSLYCIVQVNGSDSQETILDDDDCPLAILMTSSNPSSIMFHVRRRPADSQPRRRKKKVSGSAPAARPGSEPILLETAADGTPLDNARRLRLVDAIEIGSGNGAALQLYGPGIQPRHCVVAVSADGGYCVTPLHADAVVLLDGTRIHHSRPLRNGSVLQFGRTATFRFVDPSQDGVLERNNYSHFGSGSIYSLDRSVNSPQSEEMSAPTSPSVYDHEQTNTESVEHQQQQPPVPGPMEPRYQDNYETTFDLEGNVETKSVCSARSGGSGRESRTGAGQEAILPAVLEFPESTQAAFLSAVVSRLDPGSTAFKLAPVYTLYLCARYRASTHYRPELAPTERAHRLTAFLAHTAELIHRVIVEKRHDDAAQAFWMANGSELLHFLKNDRHISTFSVQAQEILAAAVQTAFSNLVNCVCSDLTSALQQLVSRDEITMDMSSDSNSESSAERAASGTVRVLAAAMLLLRRARANAALTIQLYSHLFHYINAVAFNELVRAPGSPAWGAALASRLGALHAWAERQGLELAAEVHLARCSQAARLLAADRSDAERLRRALHAAPRLNSLQVRALLTQSTQPHLLDLAVRHARALADELAANDGRELTLEENPRLSAQLLIPGDGFSAEVVRGVPPGLADFLAPLQRAGLCRLTLQPHALGTWSVYMNGVPNIQRTRSPVVQIVRLQKNASGMGLSIVAAKGAGQSQLGIYVKSVVEGGAAAQDGRLAAGDQLLSVDGRSLLGLTQERAAELLVRTGPVVTLEVAKQGAVLHGLATLLQPSRDDYIESDWMRGRRNSGTFTNPGLLFRQPPETELATAIDYTGPTWRADGVKASRSVPHLAQQHNTNLNIPTEASRSHSSHNLRDADAFYQNVRQAKLAELGDEVNRRHNRSHDQLISSDYTQRGLSVSQELMPNYTTSSGYNNHTMYSPQERGSISSGHERNVPQMMSPAHDRSGQMIPPHERSLPIHSANDRNVPIINPHERTGPLMNSVHDRSGLIISPHERNGSQPVQTVYNPQERGSISSSHDRSNLTHDRSASIMSPHDRNSSQYVNGSDRPPNFDRSYTQSASDRLSLGSHLDQDCGSYNPMSPSYEEFSRKSDRSVHSVDERNQANDSKEQEWGGAPKSILKWRGNTNNTSTDVHDVTRNMSTWRLSDGGQPPAPPERASSFAVMSAVAAVTTPAPLSPPLVASGQQSTPPSSRDKRVSFHAPEGEVAASTPTTPAITERHDPDRFIEEAEHTMLTTTTHTPGVIGAQEVYKDPRARRLAERAAQQSAAKCAAPDELTFHEKMKLFALDNGERTPQEKLKVSRAQRDIDAVH